MFKLRAIYPWLDILKHYLATLASSSFARKHVGDQLAALPACSVFSRDLAPVYTLLDAFGAATRLPLADNGRL